jgi:hypothetical protein
MEKSQEEFMEHCRQQCNYKNIALDITAIELQFHDLIRSIESKILCSMQGRWNMVYDLIRLARMLY